MKLLQNKKGGFFEDMAIGKMVFLVIVLVIIAAFIWYMLAATNDIGNTGINTISSNVGTEYLVFFRKEKI